MATGQTSGAKNGRTKRGGASPGIPLGWAPVPPTLGQALVADGVVAPEQWDRALADSDGDPVKARRRLVESGQVPAGTMLALLARVSGLEVADNAALGNAGLALEGLSFQFLRHHRVVPFRQEDGVLHVAVGDPDQEDALRALAQFSGRRVRPWLSLEENILRSIEVNYGLGAGMKDGLGPGGEDVYGEGLDPMEELSSEAPAIRLFNYLVYRAVDQGASDIHVEPQEDRLRVRFRVDGVMHDQESLSPNMQAALTSRIKLLAKMNIAERRRAQDGKIGTSLGGRDLDLRVSTLPTVHGESVVIRILYRDTLSLDLGGLGMPERQMKVIQDLVERPNGLILVTGPTGSGKTTTLYAALRHINSPERKIITIEDPVEYRLPGVNQIQVNPQVGLTFASGLRSIVRQDPDVILVGEIRDRETADIAVHASLTGHMVFSTLHTNDAPGAVTRLQDMGVDSFLISSSLMAVLGQRLVRVLCPECKRAAPYSGGLEIEGIKPGDMVWRAVGCEACANTGYRGRTAILELMMASDELKELINRQADSDALRRMAVSQGMRTLRQDGWDKVSQGITSLEEVLRVTT